MADDKKHTYDESKVKTLSSIEHIRLRTGWNLQGQSYGTVPDLPPRWART